MTDNSSFYKSFTFRNLCKRLGLKHIRTKPYTPRTNGKAERFIQTCCGVGLRAGLPPLTTENRTASPIGCTATIGTDLVPVSVVKCSSANSA